jgi:DNA end-binding protein Ku
LSHASAPEQLCSHASPPAPQTTWTLPPFNKEELDAVKLESTRIIDIEKFVPRASIDRLYWDAPYHFVPTGKTGIETYTVIRAAMGKQNKLAIGRLVISTREPICAIEIEEGGLALNTLRTAEEVRALDN